MSILRKPAAAAAALSLLMVALGAQASVNKSVKIPDNGQADGASSVNGSVTVGSYASVNGDLSTVNGSIRVGDGSTVEDVSTVNGSLKIADGVTALNLETVNGKIWLGSNVIVNGEISAVNGGIEVNSGSSVARDLSNVNGEIALIGSQVSGDVETVNGNVNVVEGAVIKGNLVVRKPGGWGWKKNKKPKVVIGPGSRVEGVIRLQREVRLYISETAEVGGVEGEMSLEDAERFSGNRP